MASNPEPRLREPKPVWLVFLLMLPVLALLAGFITLGVVQIIKRAHLEHSPGLPGAPLIQGGPTLSESRPVADFNAVSLTGIGALHITQGATESLTLNAPEDQLDRIETEVRGNTLYIRFVQPKLSFNFGASPNLNFDLMVKELRKLELAGATKAECAALKFDQLTIKTAGAADLNLQGLEGEHLNCDFSGASKANLAGKVTSQKVVLSGAAQYEAKNLISEEVTVELSGAGKATVNASNSLKANASGAASIRYIGNPAQVEKSASGAASVKPL